MAAIGKINRLSVRNKSKAGVYLDAEELGSVLLPLNEVPGECEPGSLLDVFLYHDTNAHLVATTFKPLVKVGEFACLTVVSLTNIGAFLDWGLPKDLLLPFSEQRYELKEGKQVLIRVFLDKYTHRAVATTRVDKFLDSESNDFKAGQSVDLLIAEKTDIGFKAIVDNSHWGVLYSDELFQTLTQGQRISGFIKKIRADKKIDLTLNKPGHAQIAQVGDKIIEVLKEHNGFIMITDRSPPEVVYSVFKVSKKVYKKAIGALYKQRQIIIEQQGIRLVNDRK